MGVELHVGVSKRKDYKEIETWTAISFLLSFLWSGPRLISLFFSFVSHT